MKNILLLLGFAFALNSGWAQKINEDSLVQETISHSKVIAHNHDSLLKLLPASKSQQHTGLNADSALKYTKILDALRDSIFNLKMSGVKAVALNERQRRQDIQAQKEAYQTSLRLYILTVVMGFLLLFAIVFWRNNRQNKRAKAGIQHAHDELELTRQQLIQSEKMASLGELTAGIAHEIQNPLNFVNNFAEVSIELLDEMQTELRSGDKEEAIAVAADVKQNLEKIRYHSQRADGIVKGMLQHSRVGSTTKEPININNLADEYLRLAYHGLRAKDKSFNVKLVTDFDEKLPDVNIVPQDIVRVMLNLFINAFYSLQQKQKSAGIDYKPTVEVSTKLITTSSANKAIAIIVKDNGMGIPDTIKDKIMQPFFTTKPTGEGTGLGLSMSYDIVVKGHGGTIDMATKEGEYTEFIISIPL
jgi:two-component system NtrC family sensor kinase